MTGLSVNRTSSCHSANAKLTMKISKTEHTHTHSDVLTGVGPTPKVLQVKWQSDAPTECQHLRHQRPHADRYFPLTLTSSRSASLTHSTLGLISRFSASHCGVFGRGFRLGFKFGSWWHFWNKYLCLRAEQHIRDSDSVASNTLCNLFS